MEIFFPGSIIRSLENKFGDEAMKHRLCLTPGTPRFIVMRDRVADEQDKLPAKVNAIYRSGVGTLLYLTKHCRTDLCNAVRELSKTLDRPAVIRINVAAITIDGAFTTRRSRFLHAKQESEIMMILTSVLANLGSSTVGSPYLVPPTALLANCATGGATNHSRATDILRRCFLGPLEHYIYASIYECSLNT